VKIKEADSRAEYQSFMSCGESRGVGIHNVWAKISDFRHVSLLWT
jgi:hypothetical protein